MHLDRMGWLNDQESWFILFLKVEVRISGYSIRRIAQKNGKKIWHRQNLVQIILQRAPKDGQRAREKICPIISC